MAWQTQAKRIYAPEVMIFFLASATHTPTGLTPAEAYTGVIYARAFCRAQPRAVAIIRGAAASLKDISAAARAYNAPMLPPTVTYLSPVAESFRLTEGRYFR